MAISVLVVTYNSARTIRRCVEAVLAQLSRGDELIVTDNASTDDTVDIIRHMYPAVTLVQAENLGYGAGVNAARDNAHGDYLFILNPDAYLEPGALDALRAQAVDHAVIAPQQLDMSRMRLYGARPADLFGFPVPESVSATAFYVDGAAIFVSAATFDRLGGMDSNGFLFGEDSDFSWRAQLLGFTVLDAKDAAVVHEQGASIAGGREDAKGRTTSVRRRFYTERNTIRNIVRNYAALTVAWVLPLYAALLLGEIVLLALTGNIAAAQAVGSAIIDNVRHLRRTLKERRIIQLERVVSDRVILSRMYHGSGKWILFRQVGIPKFVP